MKVRLQRFLADCGVASRRECEAMILSGRVCVNGQVRVDMPVMIEPETDVVTVDNLQIGTDGGGLQEQEKVYFLLNKPKGILVTNYDPSQRKTVGELMTGVKERVFPVGRLDMDARGALLMTNDGELANRLTHPRYGIEKTYIIEVDGRIGHDDIEKIKHGIWLGPESGQGEGAVKTEKFRIKLIGRERGRTIMEVRLSEAKNREIRRVMARLGHVVRDLNRVAIAGKITTQGLMPGEFRPLKPQEVKWLFYASSPEFHNEKRSSTQQWYEQKEMEKERKRLAAEPPVVKKPVPQMKPAKSAIPKRLRELPERPVRKGRKPFIPPTGRNAGVALGGNYIGRKRLETEKRMTPKPQQEAPMPEQELPPMPKAAHPLGKAAKSDE